MFPAARSGALFGVLNSRLWASIRRDPRGGARNCETDLKTKVPLAAKPVSPLKLTGCVAENPGRRHPLSRAAALPCLWSAVLDGRRAGSVYFKENLCPAFLLQESPRAQGLSQKRTRGRCTGPRAHAAETVGTASDARRDRPPAWSLAPEQGPETTAPGYVPVTPPLSQEMGSLPHSCPAFWGLQGGGEPISRTVGPDTLRSDGAPPLSPLPAAGAWSGAQSPQFRASCGHTGAARGQGPGRLALPPPHSSGP